MGQDRFYDAHVGQCAYTCGVQASGVDFSSLFHVCPYMWGNVCMLVGKDSFYHTHLGQCVYACGACGVQASGARQFL